MMLAAHICRIAAPERHGGAHPRAHPDRRRPAEDLSHCFYLDQHPVIIH
ncbi:hypothetical protein [Streptomyces sp. NPDC056707]